MNVDSNQKVAVSLALRFEKVVESQVSVEVSIMKLDATQIALLPLY